MTNERRSSNDKGRVIRDSLRRYSGFTVQRFNAASPFIRLARRSLGRRRRLRHFHSNLNAFKESISPR